MYQAKTKTSTYSNTYDKNYCTLLLLCFLLNPVHLILSKTDSRNCADIDNQLYEVFPHDINTSSAKKNVAEGSLLPLLSPSSLSPSSNILHVNFSPITCSTFCTPHILILLILIIVILVLIITTTLNTLSHNAYSWIYLISVDPSYLIPC